MSDVAAELGAVPVGQRCVWPGCTRRRAAGRATGSGRQKEYCLQADPAEAGGGPVHNARNRWAALRTAGNRAAPDLAAGDDAAAGRTRPAGTAADGGDQGASVPDQFPYSAAKKRAGDLLEQTRRQHAVAIDSLRAERELYQRLGEQLTALGDPASLDLEIAAIASRAGASVAQAEEDAARARRAQLAAERERDDAVRLRGHADAAAEQLAADAEEAEATLAERIAEFARDRAALHARTRDAEARAQRAGADARRSVDAAHAQAAREVGHARARAAEETANAQRTAEAAAADARREAAEQVMAAFEQAREQVAAAEARADAQTDQARRDAEAARREAAAAIAGAASANARADARTTEAERAGAEIGRLREELRRLADAREAEVGRLTAAHQAALETERARSARAETELDALRGPAS